MTVVFTGRALDVVRRVRDARGGAPLVFVFGAVPSQQPSPKTNTSGTPSRAARTRRTTSSARSVKTTVTAPGRSGRPHAVRGAA